MPYAENALDGKRVYFEDDGDTGPAVVFSGGFMEPVGLVRGSPIAQALRAEEFRHIFVDHRGHGRSDKPHEVGAYAMLLRVTDVVAVLDELGIERRRDQRMPITILGPSSPVSRWVRHHRQSRVGRWEPKPWFLCLETTGCRLAPIKGSIASHS